MFSFGHPHVVFSLEIPAAWIEEIVVALIWDGCCSNIYTCRLLVIYLSVHHPGGFNHKSFLLQITVKYLLGWTLHIETINISPQYVAGWEREANLKSHMKTLLSVLLPVSTWYGQYSILVIIIIRVQGEPRASWEKMYCWPEIWFLSCPALG